MLTQIRIHGRGGQGVVLASELLATAAFAEDPDRFVRSFGVFGVERRGSPVTAFAMVGPESEMTRGRIYDPDVVLVLDPFLHTHVDVTDGLQDDGLVVMNTESDPGLTVGPAVGSFRLGILDATAIAVETLGREIPNTVMLGALSAGSDLFSIESVGSAISETFDGALIERNIEAAHEGFEQVAFEEQPSRAPR